RNVANAQTALRVAVMVWRRPARDRLSMQPAPAAVFREDLGRIGLGIVVQGEQEVAVRRSIIGLELQSTSEADHRLLQLPKVFQGMAQVIVSLRQTGFQAKRL